MLPSEPAGFRPFEIEEFLKEQASSSNRSHRRHASNSSMGTTIPGDAQLTTAPGANAGNDKKRLYWR